VRARGRAQDRRADACSAEAIAASLLTSPSRTARHRCGGLSGRSSGRPADQRVAVSPTAISRRRGLSSLVIGRSAFVGGKGARASMAAVARRINTVEGRFHAGSGPGRFRSAP
jgi:hypothetical protein